MKLHELIKTLSNIAGGDPDTLDAHVMLDTGNGMRHLATVGTLVLDGPNRVITMFDVRLGNVPLPPPIPAMNGPMRRNCTHGRLDCEFCRWEDGLPSEARKAGK